MLNVFIFGYVSLVKSVGVEVKLNLFKRTIG